MFGYIAAVAAASGALYVRFKAKNSQFREQTLSLQAGVIAHYLKTAPEGPIHLPSYVTEGFKVNNGRYPDVRSDDPTEKRYAEVRLFLQRKKQERDAAQRTAAVDEEQ